jgi:mono/diheme cytochrome c family protein
MGATAAEIQAAIAANAGGMGSLSSLTALEIQTIATALAVTTPPTPIDGAALYASKCSSCHGDLATSSMQGSTAAAIQSAINNNRGGMGSLSTLTADQVAAIATALATTTPPQPTACTSFTYSVWGACQSNNTQTRTQLTASPAGCTGGTPVLSQACTYVPPTPVCGSCHSIPPATGKHAFHSTRATCATCHGTGYSTTTVNSATHVNGVNNVVSSLNFNATTSTCGTPGCHGSRAW